MGKGGGRRLKERVGRRKKPIGLRGSYWEDELLAWPSLRDKPYRM